MTLLAIAAQLADLLAWYAATQRGAVESNPLMQGPAVAIAKTVGVVVVIVGAQFLTKPWQRRTVLGFAIVVGVAGAITGVLA